MTSQQVSRHRRKETTGSGSSPAEAANGAIQGWKYTRLHRSAHLNTHLDGCRMCQHAADHKDGTVACATGRRLASRVREANEMIGHYEQVARTARQSPATLF